MDWILDHLKLVIAIAAAIAYWLNNRRKAEAEEADEVSPANADARERTRRIQEEIQRKIAERHRGAAAAPAPPPPMLRPDLPSPMPSFGDSPEPHSTMRRVVTDDWEQRAAQREAQAETAAHHAAALGRQERLADELRALEATRLMVSKRTAEFATAEAAKAARKQSSAQTLVSELRGARNLRQAVVWREVIGEPVGLRR